MVIFLVLFPVAINTEAGLRTTSPRLIEMLRSFGATPQQIFFKLSLPSAMPFILAGLKLGIGRGLIGVVVAELFGSRAGLGRLISQSADAFNMPDLFAGVIILAVAGIVMTAGFTRVERDARAMDAGLSGTRDPVAGQTQKLAIDRLSKRFGDLAVLQDINVAIDARRVHRPGRPERLRQDDACCASSAGLEPSSAGDSAARRQAVREPGSDRGFVFQSDNLLPWRTVLAQRDHRPGNRGRCRRAAATTHASNCCGSSALKASRTIIRASSPAACASASISPARSRSIPKSC